jgi:methylated-DNA-[protein]-cysteine S-methyltransferase
MDKQTIDHRPEQIDCYAALNDGHGRLFVAYSRLGISAIRPAKDAPGFETWFRGQLGRPLKRCTTLPADVVEAIHEHLHERDRRVPLDLRASTDFERAVLLKTREIPRGEVQTYGSIARAIGEPGAAQEVGVALSRNPIMYLIPCHRVVRSDGSLAGYAGGGVRAKRELLLREGYKPIRVEPRTLIRRAL